MVGDGLGDGGRCVRGCWEMGVGNLTFKMKRLMTHVTASTYLFCLSKQFERLLSSECSDRIHVGCGRERKKEEERGRKRKKEEERERKRKKEGIYSSRTLTMKKE